MGVTKRPKGQRKKPDGDKLAIPLDQARRRIEITFVMVGGHWAVVVSFNFHQNRWCGFLSMGGGIALTPIALADRLASLVCDCVNKQSVTTPHLVVASVQPG